MVFSLLNVNCCPVGRPKNLYFFVFFQVAPSVGSFLSPSTLSKMAYFCPWQFKAVAWLWLWSTNLGYTIDVLWDQPINFIHVASTSEFCENQQDDLFSFEIVPCHFWGASEVQMFKKKDLTPWYKRTLPFMGKVAWFICRWYFRGMI